ncbi:hypothetical protein B0H19DRAFT_1123410 [Mycena capillaripes]|nr:hypothetical protein B0H19DRAFT_1123410 [Mycena capillaripes]
MEHGGRNPDFKTQVSRSPNDNLGESSCPRRAIVGEMEDRRSRLWLGADCWAQRYADTRAEDIRKSQDVTPRPSPAVLPSVPFGAMEGTFSHGTYGAICACFVRSKTAGLSTACTEVINTPVAQRTLGGSAADSIPTCIVLFKRTFSTHMCFAHFAGNTFNVSLLSSNG